MDILLKSDHSDFWPVFRPVPGQIRHAASRPIPARGGPAELRWLRELQRARTKRNECFNPRLFGDPAWDMLIDLYASELEQRRTSVTDLTVASGVPATTALRWIAALQRDGLVKRHNDPLDGRRIFVSLTEKGISGMRRFFDQLPRSIFPFDA